MPLIGMPSKAKLIGIVVLAILTFSLVGTALEAVDQITQEEAASTQSTQAQFARPLDTLGDNSDDNTVVATFKFVCPFH